MNQPKNNKRKINSKISMKTTKIELFNWKPSSKREACSLYLSPSKNPQTFKDNKPTTKLKLLVLPLRNNNRNHLRRRKTKTRKK